MIFRGLKIIQYIFFDMLPGFILGLLVFIFIMLLFQALRLTEFVLVHGVSLNTIGEIMGFLSISFLPALFPMALLFSIILTYSRLSLDSEIVAMKACGLNMVAISFPALVLSLIVAVISAQTSFNIAPWGNRQFELIISKLSNTKAGASLKEGAFSEGFFDLVVYANKVDSKSGVLEKIFIFDEKQSNTPITIISKSGKLIQDPQNPGHSAFLRLVNGDIHRQTNTHTKIKFDAYDIKLFDPIKTEKKEKTAQSLTLNEIKEKIRNSEDSTPEEIRTLKTEFHKRWAVSVVCVIFALLGVSISTTSNRRNANSGGLIVSLGVIILYWILYVTFEGLARGGKLPPGPSVWTPNVLFALFALYKLRKNWN